MTTGSPRVRQREYKARYQSGQVITTAVLAARMASGDALLIDARSRERFRGDVEPLDPVAGHIPGAKNRPFADNLNAGVGFKTALQLRLEFERLLGGKSPADTILMCGSGVTACHNLLAMTHAGLPGARVYAGSWSEWCSDRSRPVERGDAT
jgi:thiosulfate/3-mercaptopyruvate sulfurtransferase